MKPVTIELSEAPLFFIPGVIHLSPESPGPIEINPSVLTQEQRAWVNNAHRQRKIKVINPNGPAVETVAVDPPRPQAKDQLPSMAKDRDSEVAKVKQLLDSPFSALKKIFKDSKDLKVLRIAKTEEELRSKPRKSLLDLLSEEIENLNKVVASKVGTVDVGGKAHVVNVRKEDPNIVELLDDEDEHTVTIKMSTDEEDFDDFKIND